jgi:CheY-like chemotaxis protein
VKSVRVLLIDDEKGFTRLVKMALPQYEIREENDPTRALESAREFQPDVIVLDVVMPVLDGGDVLELLKADPTLAKVPIIFLTAIISQRHGQTERAIGGYPSLAKPISSETLAKAIENYVKV